MEIVLKVANSQSLTRSYQRRSKEKKKLKETLESGIIENKENVNKSVWEMQRFVTSKRKTVKA